MVTYHSSVLRSTSVACGGHGAAMGVHHHAEAMEGGLFADACATESALAHTLAKDGSLFRAVWRYCPKTDRSSAPFGAIANAWNYMLTLATFVVTFLCRAQLPPA